MSLHWPETLAALRRAIEPALQGPLAALPDAGPLEVVLGPADGPVSRLEPGVIVLHPGLAGPELHHADDAAWLSRMPSEAAPLALDRFRRTIGLLLEGVALHGLAGDGDVTQASSQWWSRAWAGFLVDEADPALGWLWPEAVELLLEPERSVFDNPRRAAWLLHWRRELGRLGDPGRSLELDEGEWLAFGGWLRDPVRGLGARSPLPLPSPAAVPGGPWQAPPLSHRLVHLESGPAGVRVRGPGISRAAVGGEHLELLQGSLSGGSQALQLSTVGPVGDWVVEVGSGAGRIFAAEGLEVSLRQDGQVELTMANAFAGPISGDMVELAKKFGASGTGTGRWRVAEVHEEGGAIVLSELNIDGVTVHPRMSTMFALPAKGWMEPVRRTLELLSNTPLSFREQGDKLVLTGTVAGFDVKLELRRASS